MSVFVCVRDFENILLGSSCPYSNQGLLHHVCFTVECYILKFIENNQIEENILQVCHKG